MTTRGTALLTALCLLLSCSTSLNYPSQGFSEVVGNVRDRWFHATCLPPVYPEIEFVTGPLTCGFVSNAWGCYYRGDNSIALSDTIKPALLYETVTHEYGHALMLKLVAYHVPPFEGIMAAGADVVRNYITAADIDLVCRGRVCPCHNPEVP